MKLIIFLVLALILHRPALADESTGTAFMTCDETNNRVLVRLGYAHDEPISIEEANTSIVSDDFAKGLDKKTPVTACTLKDGRKFEVSNIQGQSYAYGQGAGDPTKYFSLLMDGKPVFYKIQWGGQGSEWAPFAIFVIDHDKLTACHTTDHQVHWYENGEIDKQKCEDWSRRLTGILSMQELVALSEDKRISEYVPISKDKQVCDYFMSSRLGEEAGKQEGFEPLGSSTQGRIYTKDANIENTNMLFTIYQFASSSHYFDGSFIIYFPAQSPEKKSFLQCVQDQHCPILPKNPNEADGLSPIESVEGLINVTPVLWPDAKVISAENADEGGYWPQRYVSTYLRSIEGKFYIYLQPLNRDIFPRGLVYLIGESGKLEKYCTYKGLKN